mmetsp:Transcript_18152/g.36825  ORF Transcript_18152/g.36825 Transcript_18152/m.36825 type:complete len:225 (-) Transcript_18152:1460-2134(-)
MGVPSLFIFESTFRASAGLWSSWNAWMIMAYTRVSGWRRSFMYRFVTSLRISPHRSLCAIPGQKDSNALSRSSWLKVFSGSYRGSGMSSGIGGGGSSTMPVRLNSSRRSIGGGGEISFGWPTSGRRSTKACLFFNLTHTSRASFHAPERVHARMTQEYDTMFGPRGQWFQVGPSAVMGTSTLLPSSSSRTLMASCHLPALASVFSSALYTDMSGTEICWMALKA